MSVRERIIVGLHCGYKCAVSPALHAIAGTTSACRFQPTCSEYAAIAMSEYGAVRGSWMTILRLLRCHPFYRGGFDPVQPNPQKHQQDLPGMRQRPLP